MIVDVIIPTYRRPKRCRRAAESVLAAAPGISVIVVEQSSNPVTVPFEHPRVTTIRLQKPGLPNARNVGIRKSSADILLFMDDDAEMQPGCVDEHLRRHLSDGRIGIVAGRIRQTGNTKWANTSTVAHIDMKSGNTTGNFDLDFDGPVAYATGGHFSVKRCVLGQSGMFDRRFRGSALFEDVDFSLRVRRYGFAITYAPQAVVTHSSGDEGGCSTGSKITRLLDRIHNHALFYARHVHSVPGREFLLEMRNVAEFASRTDTGGHNPLVFSQCFFSLVSGFSRGVITRRPKYQESKSRCVWKDLRQADL